MRNVLGNIEVPKECLSPILPVEAEIEWPRVVPVMFDGKPLTGGAKERGNFYSVPGEAVPVLVFVRAKGVFSDSSRKAPIMQRRVYLRGIILTSYKLLSC